MITVYHGSRPYWPLLASLRHLGHKEDIDPVKMINPDWNWRLNPLYIAGPDKKGSAVCCLVHGRHSGLYRRALDGIAAIFCLPIYCVDVDDLLFQQNCNNVIKFAEAKLAHYFPDTFGRRFRKTIDEIIEPHLSR